MGQGSSAAGCHHQENKARNLQPQLVQDPPEGSPRRGNGTLHSPQEAAAFGLALGYARDYTQLLCGGNLIHSSILTASGDTMTPTCACERNCWAQPGI